MLGSFWGHFGCHFVFISGVILVSFWGHLGYLYKRRFLYRSLFEVGRVLEPKMGPTWGQVGVQIRPSWTKNRPLTALKFWHYFLIVFGASWGPFWNPFGVQNGTPKWAQDKTCWILIFWFSPARGLNFWGCMGVQIRIKIVEKTTLR